MTMILLTMAGIALPSLLLTFAVRRWLERVPWRYALLFLAMTFVFLHGAVFTSKVPVPVDEVARGYPYRGVVGEITPRNPLTNDTAKLFLPWMQVVREELGRGSFPLWNRYSFSGYPLLANGESAPFSPLFLATLFVPLPKQIVAMAGLKIFVSLLFGYLFAKRQRTSDAAACFAATVFAWSVFQAVFLYYSTTAVTAFLPFALYALAFAHEQGGRRGAIVAALSVAALLANGHPESVLHIAIAAAGVIAIDFALSEEKRVWMKRLRTPLLGTVAGLALSAPAWVPVLQQVFLSTRYADLRRTGGHAAAYPLTALWAMVSPNGFGNPVRHNWSWILNYSLVAASYVGLLVLALVATAALSSRTSARDRLWIAFAIVLWLVAMRWTPVGELAGAIPPFSITANDKLRFVALFLAAIVTARMLDRLRESRSWLFFVFGTVFALLALYVYDAKRAVLRPSDLAGVLAVAAVAAALLLARRFAPIVAFAVIAGELFLLNHGFNALVESRYYKPPLPIIDALRRAAPPEPHRIVGLDWTFLPNASAQYGLEDIRGSDPMSYDAYTEYLKPIVIDDPSIDLDRVVDLDHPMVDALNVRFALTEPAASLGGKWRLLYSGADGRLYENSAVRPRFYARSGDAEVTVVGGQADRVIVRVVAREASFIASSHVAGPGWTVRVGARRVAVEKVDGLFIGFRVPPGRHTIEVAYRPLAFWGTLPLALVAALWLSFTRFWNTGGGQVVIRCPTQATDH